MKEIRQIVYASKASSLMTPDDLSGILEVARRKNLAAGITGILIYRNGSFLQVLEGPKDSLDELLVTLSRDKRHCDVTVLLDGITSASAFGAWSMAFNDITGLNPATMPGYSRFLENGFGSTECVRYPHKVLRMALSFRSA